MERRFPVLIQRGEDNKYIAECPVIEGCFSQGDTIEEAIENIKEAIQLCLETDNPEERTAPIIMLTEVTV